jgi:hypothetical protein
MYGEETAKASELQHAQTETKFAVYSVRDVGILCEVF